MDVTAVMEQGTLGARERQALTSTRTPRVSVIVPTLNEAANLPAMLGRFPRGVHELIIVDGGSTDATVATARRLWPGVRVLQQPGSGKGAALSMGFAAATGDILVTLDGDGSTDPAEIPRFVSALKSGADLAKGSRFLDDGGSDDLTPLRRVGAHGFTALVNILFGAQYTDLCYGYTAFWRHHLGRISIASGFDVEASMTISALHGGLSVVEVASFEHARVHGASKLRMIRDGLQILMTILRARLQTRTGAEPAEAPASL